MKTRIIPFLLSLFLLSACSDPYLTRQDNVWLYEIRSHWFHEKADKEKILYRIVNSNPVDLAKNEAKEKNYKLISIAGGYKTSSDDAKIFGVKCAGKIETEPFVFGCVPPPTVVFKQIYRYNATLVQQPGFPDGVNCSIDQEIESKLHEASVKEEIRAKEEAKRRITHWEEERMKFHLYND